MIVLADGGMGTWTRWPHFGQLSLSPAVEWRRVFLQAGQANSIILTSSASTYP